MAKHMTTQEILSANLNRLMGDTITQAQVSRMAIAIPMALVADASSANR